MFDHPSSRPLTDSAARRGLVPALLVLFCLLFALPAHAGPIDAKSAILMDATTGRILYEQRADLRVPPASLTKVMSMYVAMNAISARKIDYNNKVKISRAAARTRGSSMNLREDEKVTVDRLFYGMAVASGNDASMAVAEHAAGSPAAFVKQMNALARKLGMKRTTFVNVHGLPAEGQFTTARDMLRMARSYIAHYPKARRYHLAKSVSHNGHTEPNHNPLVGYYRGLEGLKTGWIYASGYNIIVSARRNGHRLIGVILGAPNTEVRAAEARRLLNAGFKTIAKKRTSAAAELGVSAKQEKRLKKSPGYSAAPKAAAKKAKEKTKKADAKKDAPKKAAAKKSALKPAPRPDKKAAERVEKRPAKAAPAPKKTPAAKAAPSPVKPAPAKASPPPAAAEMDAKAAPVPAKAKEAPAALPAAVPAASPKDSKASAPAPSPKAAPQDAAKAAPAAQGEGKAPATPAP